MKKKESRKDSEAKKEDKDEVTKLKKSLNKIREQIKNSSLSKSDKSLGEYAKENDVSYGPIELKLRRTLKGHTAKVYEFDFCKSIPRNIVSASQDGKLIVWNFLSAHKLYVILLKSTWVLTCAYAPGGNNVSCGGLDNIIYTYKLGDEEVPDNPEELKGHEQCILRLKYLDDDRILSTSGDGTIKLWDVGSNTNSSTFYGHANDVLCIDVSTENNTFITGGIDKQAMLWDVRTDKPSLSFSGNVSDVNSIKYFPNQNAFATGDENGHVILYDIRGDRELMKYSHEQDTKVNGVTFSNSGKYMFTATDHNLNIWNTVEGELMKSYPQDGVVSAVGVNPTGEAVVISTWTNNLRFYA